MSNPVFGRMKDERGYATFGPPDRSKSAAQGTATYQAPTPDQLQTMYDAPSATSVDTGRMTYDDVVVKTAMIFVFLLAGAVVGWQVPGLFFVGLIGGLVLGLVNSFKRNPSPVLILGYGLFEGLFLGAISQFFENFTNAEGVQPYNGIVIQAVLGTLGVFAVVLVAFRSGKVRATPKLNKIALVAMGGYLVFLLVNMMVGLFGGPNIYSGPLGLLIGAFAVLLASYSLVMDFEFIKAGVEQGAPAKMAWYGAFGLTVTLVWLYIEILRILAILRGNN